MKKALKYLALSIFTSVSLLFGAAIAPAAITPNSSLTPSVYAAPNPFTGEEVNGTTIDSDLLLPSDLRDLEATENTENSTSTSENADGESDSESSEDTENPEDAEDQTPICQSEVGNISYFFCPLINTLGNLSDSIYNFIEQFLVIKPISSDTESPIFKVWSYVRDLTNIIFVIFILIVIYSQFTGLGISNYGVKRILPRLIIAIILVNLSFIITSLAVDVSNIIGHSLSDFFNSIAIDINLTINPEISWANFAKGMTSGVTLAWLAITAAGGAGALLWILILALLGAAISLITGLITICLRQGVVLILIMIAPLAFVSYLLPNTEKWFEKWKQLLFQMIFFYPMFSFLFGASKLAGLSIISAANGDGFQILLGLAVQVIPLILSVSLLKMSSTILGKVSGALDKAANPARGTLSDWAGSHREKSRQHYLRNNHMLTGARLRNYLNYRKKLRENDTEETKATVENRALARALNISSGYRGLDAEGNAVYRRFASGYTKRAKESSMQRTITDNAKHNLENTLSDYSNIFQGPSAKRLANGHAEAYVDSMMQAFRAENIAQGDQNYLLDRYLQAAKNKNRAPYEYNRLIASANGGLGHIGEATIMGQVLQRSADIETKRRREALVISNKFNLSKGDFRGMVFDKKHINDDGFETDDMGNVIEDSQYRQLPGTTHQEWDQYIAVHKQTNKEISAEQYQALSDKKKKEYRRVRYMNIHDDAGDVVQTVFEDDAGYMKELLLRDITVGDPINRRYNISYGLAHTDSEQTGILRRYHSTISAGMLASGYKEHAAEVTPMITAQANSGFITSIGQYNIANLQSLTVASKAGPIFQNDAYVIKDWARLVNSLTSTTPGETFEDLFPDQDIDNYRDVNGRPLGGMRLTFNAATGRKEWTEINRNDPTLTLEDKKNLVKHKIIPRAAQKLAGVLNRNMTPNILENQKPATLKALILLAQTLKKVGLDNINDDLDMDLRLNPDTNIFEAKDPQIVKQYIQEAQQTIEEQLAKLNNLSNSLETPQSGINKAQQNLQNSDQTLDRLIDSIDDLFAFEIENPDVLYNQLRSIFSSNPHLQPFANDANSIIERYSYLSSPISASDAIYQTTNYDDAMKANLASMKAELDQLIYQANSLR